MWSGVDGSSNKAAGHCQHFEHAIFKYKLTLARDTPIEPVQMATFLFRLESRATSLSRFCREMFKCRGSNAVKRLIVNSRRAKTEYSLSLFYFMIYLLFPALPCHRQSQPQHFQQMYALIETWDACRTVGRSTSNALYVLLHPVTRVHWHR
jgi:hypothetical protein